MAILRPFEINKDADNYEIHAENTCKFTECGFYQNIDYDYGYFFLLSVAKIFLEDKDAMLFLGGLALALKLILIARVTSYSVISLFFYFSVFFLMHDVSALRVSVALSFYLLALFLVSRRMRIGGCIAYGASMASHFQALIASITHFSNVIIGKRYWLAIGVVVLSQLAVILELVPTTSILNLLVNEDSRRLSQNIYLDDSIFRLKGTNLLILLLLVSIIYPLKKIATHDMVFNYSFSSVITGYAFYWLFAGVPVFPDRILQFFWVPLTLLVSFGKKNMLTYISTIVVSVAFFSLNVWYAPIIFS